MIDKSTLANIHSYVEDKVGYIILDNPSRLNAISLSMWEKIGILLKEYENNNNIRCVVLKGKGKKAFSAGADISEFNDNRSQSDTVLKYDNVSKNSLQILQRFSKPTIALIDGYCIGGGLATALSCDIRLASKKSTFAIPAAKLGLAYDYLGIKKLRDIVGPSRAKYIFFTARQFTSDEAMQMGIIEQIFNDSDFDEHTLKVLNAISDNAPLTIASAKLAIDADPQDSKMIQRCREFEQVCFSSKDYEEGRLAFSEKRKPIFKGH
ncbi:MAG: enoyl-CoA hydratase [Pelagibacterales bacterium]|jgi:enoyl-CoA hydratase/carnithine racemase|nr:enoyl-CoA hydratase [Pelagibacterales bacterium]MDG2268356.1 enoyl-CoA hydratase [Alphaproteobacteria bacterium]